MGIYIAKLTTFLREWLNILRASGRNLMHKRLNIPVQGFHLPLSKQLTSLWGSRVKWRSGLCFENGESLSHLFILFCVVWLWFMYFIFKTETDYGYDCMGSNACFFKFSDFSKSEMSSAYCFLRTENRSICHKVVRR